MEISRLPEWKDGEWHGVISIKPRTAEPGVLTPLDIATYIKKSEDPPLNLSGKLQNKKYFDDFVSAIKRKISNLEEGLKIVRTTGKIFLVSDLDEMSLLIANCFLDEEFYNN